MYYEKIREIRKEKKLTQLQIAEVLEMKQEQYQRYESGKRDLPIKHLITLCKYFNISADYILGLKDENE